MKNAIIAAVAVLMVIGLVSCSYAGPIDVIGGQKVNITVKAEVPSLLKVHLSDTTIDFGTIKSTATQQKKIDIKVTSLNPNANTPTMTVTGAAALANGKNTIDTEYGWETTTSRSDLPMITHQITWYIPATLFNGKHDLPGTSAALWAKIKPTNVSATGVYQNTLTVVFCQTT